MSNQVNPLAEKIATIICAQFLCASPDVIRENAALISPLLPSGDVWIPCSSLPPANPRNPANSVRVETYSPDMREDYRIGIGRWWFARKEGYMCHASEGYWGDGISGTPSHWRVPTPPVSGPAAKEGK